MIPILFEHDATVFTGHGLGDLVDTISCVVKQTETNEFELELKYPMDGRLFKEIRPNRIIYAKVNNNKNTTFVLSGATLPYQAFRIYSCEKEFSGYITVKAQHVSYDLANVFIMPYDTSYDSYNYYGKPVDNTGGYVYNPARLIDLIYDPRFLVSGTNPFEIRTIDYNYINNETFTIKEPRSVRSLLFDSQDSLIANFGGRCAYDNFKLRFYGYISPEIKATIEYGHDLIDVQQENNITEMITGIIPYYTGKDPRYTDSDYHGPDSIIYGQPIYASGNFERQVVVPVDVTSKITDAGLSNGGYNTVYDSATGKMIDVPNVDTFGQAWAQENELGVPEVNITLDYARINADIQLYDLVRVYFDKLGIDTTAIVSSTEYDVLTERCMTIELGKSKAYNEYYDFSKDFRGKIRRN